MFVPFARLSMAMKECSQLPQCEAPEVSQRDMQIDQGQSAVTEPERLAGQALGGSAGAPFCPCSGRSSGTGNPAQ